METLSLNRMNTNFYIELSNCEQTNWREKVTTWLSYVEREWSRFRDDNELTMLNQSKKGEVIQLSPALYDVLRRANDYFNKTDGLFSPYLKKEMEQNGYVASFPFSDVPIEQVKEQKNAFHQETRPFIFLKHQKVYKNTRQEVDLGGFAKGYIVEEIASWFKRSGKTEYGIVDGGGDMTMWSNGKKIWKIGIADPYDEGKIVSHMQIKNGAVATSNRLYRSWDYENEHKHHLLNGKTGKPVRSNIVQATAITGNLLDGEVLAKMCFLLSEQERGKWIGGNFPHSYFYVIKERE